MEVEKVTVESTKMMRADYTEFGRADMETLLGSYWPKGKQQQSTWRGQIQTLKRKKNKRRLKKQLVFSSSHSNVWGSRTTSLIER